MDQDDYKKYLVTQLLSAAISFGEIAKVSDDVAFVRECLAKAEKAFSQAVSVNNSRTPNHCRVFKSRSTSAESLIKEMRSRLKGPPRGSSETDWA